MTLSRFFALIVILSFNASTMIAQDENNKINNDFLISIEKTTDGEIKMECEKGCAWIDLNYKNGKEFQPIDEFGMTTLGDQQENADELTDFLFTIENTNDREVKLKGIKGTHFEELSFTLRSDEKQYINQRGMVRSLAISK